MWKAGGVISCLAAVKHLPTEGGKSELVHPYTHPHILSSLRHLFVEAILSHTGTPQTLNHTAPKQQKPQPKDKPTGFLLTPSECIPMVWMKFLNPTKKGRRECGSTHTYGSVISQRSKRSALFPYMHTHSWAGAKLHTPLGSCDARKASHHP